ncbi:MBL fold metallo-hydrolase [Ktedonosporobacter rubrisoli]|uniref:MBL fold metallo-hydrolase n=1 Tax=Ktedonosporobacter rubrisoli TaxID=2509675 RepID=UPI0013EEE4B7|nr:MBL fold metallo-hydrolase [Ktedonosporobacter rubrisoli]
MNPVSAQKPQVPDFALRPRQVHTITDRFSMANTYLITAERTVVVDPGSELNVRLLQKYLQNILHRTSADIDLIVLTHLHFDHTAGVEALRRICSAPVAASAAVKRLALNDGSHKVFPRITHLAEQMLPGSLQHLDLFLPAYTQQVKLIDLWLEDVEGLPFHPDWRVLASPGHTPESLCLYNAFTRELLCGDTVITIEGGAPLLRSSANRAQLEETLRVLRGLQIQYLYPGHGRPILSEHPLESVDVEW